MPQEQIIPYGYCHCGCGRQTTLQPFTHKRRGWKKGVPFQWIHGHHRTQERPHVEDMGHFKIDGVYCRLIPLTQGMYAIVWESDYEYLMQWRWFAKFSECTNSYYAAREFRGEDRRQRCISMHRQLMGLKTGESKKGDHHNGCSLDNRRGNLRSADKFQNAQNSKRKVNNTSGYKCVDWCPQMQMWRVRIGVNGKRYHLGYFKPKEEAYAVYCEAAKKLHGEFARVA